MYPCHHRRFIDCTVLTLGALPPASLLAADAQQAVAQPGTATPPPSGGGGE